MADSALRRIESPATHALAPTELTPDQVTLIKNTVAKGATNDELQLFLHLARTYGLDPFAKEIWCIKYGNSAATIFTSRDGYLKIANGHPAFDGIHGDVVRERDHFQTTREGVEHEYAQGDRGKITGAYALVFRKDRQYPAYVFAPFDEYNAPSNGTWKKYPSAMILKVAESMALKRAFSISGLVTREEISATVGPEPGPEDADVVSSEPRRPAALKPREEREDYPGEALHAGPRPVAVSADVEVTPDTSPAGVPTVGGGPSPIEAFEQHAARVGLKSYGLGELLRTYGVVRLADLSPKQLAAAMTIDADGAQAFNADGFVTAATRRLKAAPNDRVRADQHEKAVEAAGNQFGGELLGRVVTALDRAAGLPVDPDALAAPDR